MSEAPSDKLEDVYDRRARLEYGSPAPPPDPALDRKFERMAELLADSLPCESLLDVGCGDGRYLATLAGAPAKPARIVASDISGEILTTARATAENVGVTAEFVRANLENLPLEDAGFDRVLCVQVIEHLLDPPAGLREIVRVLRPGGVLILSTDNARNRVTQALNLPRTAIVRALRLTGKRRAVVFPHRSFAVPELLGLVTGSGLEPELVQTFRFHLDPPLDRPASRRFLNRLDKRVPARGWGDLIAVVARKPIGAAR